MRSVIACYLQGRVTVSNRGNPASQSSSISLCHEVFPPKATYQSTEEKRRVSSVLCPVMGTMDGHWHHLPDPNILLCETLLVCGCSKIHLIQLSPIIPEIKEGRKTTKRKKSIVRQKLCVSCRAVCRKQTAVVFTSP